MGIKREEYEKSYPHIYKNGSIANFLTPWDKEKCVIEQANTPVNAKSSTTSAVTVLGSITIYSLTGFCRKSYVDVL